VFLAVALSAATVAGAAAAPSKVEQINVNDAGAMKIRITGDWLAAGRGGIWLSGQDEIYRLNRQTGRRVVRIPIPARTSAAPSSAESCSARADRTGF
jgi:hypothetical protein